MKVDVKKLKSEAEKFRGKNKLDKAIEIYGQIRQAGGADAKTLQKMAEIYFKLDQEDQGVKAYREAMKGYLDTGFLVQAIAVGKILQELLPDDQEINKEIEQMLAKKRGPIIGKIEPKKMLASELKPAEPQPAAPRPAPFPAKPAPEPEWDSETAESKEALKERGPIEIPEEPEAQSPAEGEVSEPEVIEESEAEKSSLDFLLFSDLAPEEFAEVYQRLRSVKIPAGLRVCREEDEGDSIFIIAEGEVEVTKKSPEGPEKQVANLKSGDFFGEFAYFTGGKRQATVKAKTDLELLEISKTDMDAILEKYPQVKEAMLRFYKDRVLDNLLALSPLTSILPPADRQELIEKLELKEAAPGETVVREGDPGGSMFLIKSGRVEVTTLDPKDRRRLTLARLSVGEFFGEVSLIKNKPRTATITALTPTELLVLDRAGFDQLAKSHPEMISLLEQTIEKRVEATIKKIIGDQG